MFSKSKGIGVFGNNVKDINIPVEVWRYCLLTNRHYVNRFQTYLINTHLKDLEDKNYYFSLLSSSTLNVFMHL